MTDVLRGPGGVPTGRLREKFDRRVGRSSRSPLAMWFWEIDRVLLLMALFLIAIGLIAVGAASPASADRYSDIHHRIAPMEYFWKQAGWVGLSIPVMLVVSMLPITLARRLALLGLVVFAAFLALTPVLGVTVNGAKRWISVGVGQFQPSEFLKPMFVVTTAWLLSFRAKDQSLPVVFITGALTAVIGGLLMLQPDFGQTVVFGLIWLTMLTVAGTSHKIIGGLLGLGVGGVVAAYFFYDTARIRIDGYLFGEGGQVTDTYQTDMAHSVLTAGGVVGTGPGGGRVKFLLPEAHTDYIFAVIGEEFGLIACAIVALLFLGIVIRVFVKLLDEEDAFRVLAAAGLAAQFGLQALINMAVNVGIAPSKGMTLPFISYGGSSMVALSIAMGLLLAFTRRNPYLSRSTYNVRYGG